MLLCQVISGKLRDVENKINRINKESIFSIQTLEFVGECDTIKVIVWYWEPGTK